MLDCKRRKKKKITDLGTSHFLSERLLRGEDLWSDDGGWGRRGDEKQVFSERFMVELVHVHLFGTVRGKFLWLRCNWGQIGAFGRWKIGIYFL